MNQDNKNEEKTTVSFIKPNIQYWKIVGEYDKKDVLITLEKGQHIYDSVKGKLHVLADISQAKRITPKARKIAKDSLEGDKIGKIALFGMNPVARVIASLITGLTNKKDIRFFDLKEKALEWLNEKA